ncbi:MAG: hypothetical protein Q4D04_13460 [Clostridia bacterium]|nr:hypothetical protein [Clostridia bacterium]
MRTGNVPFAGDTITVYNRLPAVSDDGRRVIRWQRRVLGGCLWVGKLVGNTRRSFDGDYIAVSVRIPLDTDFLPYDEWIASPERDERFTLSPGDIAVLGAVEGDITSASDAASLLQARKNSGAMTIKRVFVNDREVLGHYHLEGA